MVSSFVSNRLQERLTDPLQVAIFGGEGRVPKEPKASKITGSITGGVPMEWIEVGSTGGLLLGALAVLAIGGFMFFLGKNME
jgi:hypothetical protein